MAAFDADDGRLSVVGIPGSLRDPSYTRFTVKLALDGARQAGARTHLADLRSYDLPFCDGSQEQEDEGDVARLREEVREAEGILLGTPSYHGGYSGVLKNALGSA